MPRSPLRQGRPRKEAAFLFASAEKLAAGAGTAPPPAGVNAGSLAPGAVEFA
jgi:hypothetical protein